MMQGWRAVRRSNQLYVAGLAQPYFDIVEHALVDGDVLVVTKARGESVWSAIGSRTYHPTEYELSRLVPISDEPQRMDGRSMAEFVREERAEFRGHYRIQEILLVTTPGRHRGMVRELVTKLKQHAAGKAINWKNIKMLDGIPLNGRTT